MTKPCHNSQNQANILNQSKYRQKCRFDQVLVEIEEINIHTCANKDEYFAYQDRGAKKIPDKMHILSTPFDSLGWNWG